MTIVIFATFSWWLLTENTLHSWTVGVPAILLASYLAHRLRNPHIASVRWYRLPGFAWFFIRRSVVAGLDVALRTLKPQPDLNPGIIRVPVSLPGGTPKLLFGGVTNLLPGTLCTEFEDTHIILHVLDTNDAVTQSSQQLEYQIALLFGFEGYK